MLARILKLCQLFGSMKTHRKMKLYLYLILISAFGQFISAQTLNFNVAQLEGLSVTSPTTLDFGPDGRLYIGQVSGGILACSILEDDGEYSILDVEEIDLVQNIPNHNDDGTLVVLGARQITGILAIGTFENPVLYVSSSDPRIGGGGSGADTNLDTNSGMVSRLTWNGNSWEKVDILRGLPRSEENHANNGIVYDAFDNDLLVAVGGMTNAGSPSNNFAFITEYAYAACIIRVDLDDLEARPIQDANGANPYIFDLPTLDDPTRGNNGGNDINDPFGGNDGLNQAKLTADGPVKIFSGGYRNAYDLVLTMDGRVYTWDNGANRNWGGHPHNEGVGTATNNWIAGEPGSQGPGPNDGQVNNRDGLHLIGNITDANGTYYGGHPTPIRANPAGAGLFTHSGNGGGNQGFWRTAITNNPATTLPIDWPPVPLELADPREGDFQNAGVDDPSLFTIQSSTNGLTEYVSGSGGGAFLGDLLAASFDGNIYHVDINS